MKDSIGKLDKEVKIYLGGKSKEFLLQEHGNNSFIYFLPVERVCLLLAILEMR